MKWLLFFSIGLCLGLVIERAIDGDWESVVLATIAAYIGFCAVMFVESMP